VGLEAVLLPVIRRLADRCDENRPKAVIDSSLLIDFGYLYGKRRGGKRADPKISEGE
jgi:hypothetical protein